MTRGRVAMKAGQGDLAQFDRVEKGCNIMSAGKGSILCEFSELKVGDHFRFPPIISGLKGEAPKESPVCRKLPSQTVADKTTNYEVIHGQDKGKRFLLKNCAPVFKIF